MMRHVSLLVLALAVVTALGLVGCGPRGAALVVRPEAAEGTAALAVGLDEVAWGRGVEADRLFSLYGYSGRPQALSADNPGAADAAASLRRYLRISEVRCPECVRADVRLSYRPDGPPSYLVELVVDLSRAGDGDPRRAYIGLVQVEPQIDWGGVLTFDLNGAVLRSDYGEGDRVVLSGVVVAPHDAATALRLSAAWRAAEIAEPVWLPGARLGPPQTDEQKLDDVRRRIGEYMKQTEPPLMSPAPPR